MPVFVECGTAGAAGGSSGLAMPVEVGSELFWSETVASGAASTASATSDGVMTLTATADGYASFGVSPSAAANPRRRVLASVRVSFAVRKGDKVAWSEV